MQPQFVHSPPISSDSTSAIVLPAFASVFTATSPAGPAPRTTTSNFSLMPGSCLPEGRSCSLAHRGSVTPQGLVRERSPPVAFAASTSKGGRVSTQTASRVGTFVWHENVSTDPKRAQGFYTQLFGWEIEVFKTGDFEDPMIYSGGQMHGG